MRSNSILYPGPVAVATRDSCLFSLCSNFLFLKMDSDRENRSAKEDILFPNPLLNSLSLRNRTIERHSVVPDMKIIESDLDAELVVDLSGTLRPISRCTKFFTLTIGLITILISKFHFSFSFTLSPASLI